MTLTKPKKNVGGRPSKINSINKDAIEIMAKRGFTDVEMSLCLHVTERTFNNWKKRYHRFFQSLKANKDNADANVQRSLYERACGYSHPEVKVQWVNGFDGEKGRFETLELTKHYPPDPTSMIFWLKNRQPAKWRDKHDINVGIKLEDVLAALPTEFAREVRTALAKSVS